MTFPPGAPQRIAHLATVAGKPTRRILGLMSGTSLDGLDLALCTISGAGDTTQCALDHFVTRPYAPAERDRLRQVAFRESVSLADICTLNAWLAQVHAGHVLSALQEWGIPATEVDALASHGQTIYHAPASWRLESDAAATARHATLQLGEPDLLSVRTGILTVADFRQKEIAAGGQGAPLAPYVESLLYRGAVPRILLNLGGIANFTWLPPRGSTQPIRYGDTGPANTLIDYAARKADPQGPGYDMGGALAAAGKFDADLLARLLAHPYFALPFPKSTGPEVFGEEYVSRALEGLARGKPSAHDLLATLTQLTAQTVASSVRREVQNLSATKLFVSGGGQHNATLMRALKDSLPEIEIHSSLELGIPPDAKEALLFAVLANELLAGPGFLAPDNSGRRCAFGKLSFPN